jgi:hypothetical protein
MIEMSGWSEYAIALKDRTYEWTEEDLSDGEDNCNWYGK